jgi:hypothetical protein
MDFFIKSDKNYLSQRICGGVFVYLDNLLVILYLHNIRTIYLFYILFVFLAG